MLYEASYAIWILPLCTKQFLETALNSAKAEKIKNIIRVNL